MFFCKSKLIGFVFNPKTGSRSLRLTLLNTKVFNEVLLKPLNVDLHPYETVHRKPKDAFIYYPALKNYVLYGVFRDPLTRFLSALNFIIRTGRSYQQTNEGRAGLIGTQFFNLSESEKDKQIDKLLNDNNLIVHFQKQIEWLDEPNVRVIDYDDYENGVLNALKDIEGEKKMYWENVYKGPVLTLSDKSIQLVKEYYKEDYEFGRDKGLIS